MPKMKMRERIERDGVWFRENEVTHVVTKIKELYKYEKIGSPMKRQDEPAAAMIGLGHTNIDSMLGHMRRIAPLRKWKNCEDPYRRGRQRKRLSG